MSFAVTFLWKNVNSLNMRQFCCQIYYGDLIESKMFEIDKMRHFIKRYKVRAVELVVFGVNVA